MKPKSIGIIGGAGPLAGAFLLKKVLTLSNKIYGCYRDSDFPKITLISFPFSEMLTPAFNDVQVRNELSECLKQLRSNGATVLAIACNTLHAFLDEKDEAGDLIHLPRVLAGEISQQAQPLVLCTSTSARFGLHSRFFSCIYPDSRTQSLVDEVIDDILRGVEKEIVIKKLQKILEGQKAKTVILGCTELSLFTPYLAFIDKKIIDPLEIVAKQILQKSFLKQ